MKTLLITLLTIYSVVSFANDNYSDITIVNDDSSLITCNLMNNDGLNITPAFSIHENQSYTLVTQMQSINANLQMSGYSQFSCQSANSTWNFDISQMYLPNTSAATGAHVGTYINAGKLLNMGPDSTTDQSHHYCITTNPATNGVGQTITVTMYGHNSQATAEPSGCVSLVPAIYAGSDE